MKAFKGLDAHNQFTSGWVRDVMVCYPPNTEDIAVISGKVLHSQSLSLPPTNSWLLVKKCGTILTAHCDCKAGVGGTCSHVSAILFFVEASVRIREKKTVTQEKAYWMLPQSMQKVEYHPVSDIDFTSAKTRKKKFDKSVNDSQDEEPYRHVCHREPYATDEEFSQFLQDLNDTGTRCAILSISEPHNSKFVPLPMKSCMPKPLTELRDEQFFNMDEGQLLQECEKIDVSVSSEQCSAVEEKTRDQARSKLWYRYRSGRITASRMKAACSTSLDKPSKSLVKAICYPIEASFSSTATTWGCDHEQYARNDYTKVMAETHTNFKLSDSGFVINPTYPHIGASPDGVTSCDCCGTGLLEVKCPYCLKDSTPENHSCLKSGKLDMKHAYYYQVQTQLFVCKEEYCDFVIWTEQGLHCERVTPNSEFWEVVAEKATALFRRVILPELLCCHITNPHTKPVLVTPDLLASHAASPPVSSDSAVRSASSATNASPQPVVDMPQVSSDVMTSSNPGRPPVSSDVVTTSSDPEDGQDIWCFCRGPSQGRMIACDNSKCNYVWFHYKCVGIKRKPRGSWYCKNCQQ